jgi:hypothetical protein
MIGHRVKVIQVSQLMSNFPYFLGEAVQY